MTSHTSRTDLTPLLDELHRTGFRSWANLEEQLLGAWNKAHDLEKVLVISALPLTDAEKKVFAERLPHADLHYSVDASLQAGVKVIWKDKVLDYTVQGMVASLRETLSN